MKILAFAASLREGSYNRKLLACAVEYARQAGADVDVAHFREFVAPAYNADDQDRTGFPESIMNMAERIHDADGLIIASPEYNYSMSGVLKNTLDWISRIRPVPLRGKSGLLLAASSGQIGGIRGLWQLRIPLEGMGMHLYPDMYALPWGDRMFDEDGNLLEEVRAERLQKTVDGYLDVAKRIAGM